MYIGNKVSIIKILNMKTNFVYEFYISTYAKFGYMKIVFSYQEK